MWKKLGMGKITREFPRDFKTQKKSWKYQEMVSLTSVLSCFALVGAFKTSSVVLY